MVTRRDALKALSVSCMAVAAKPLFAADENGLGTGVRLHVPAHACDCHSHIIGPYNRYPMVESRVYTPPTVTVEQLKAMHAELGIERSVLIQPSFYGTDNSCLVDALAELGPTGRGIAVVTENPSSAEIDRLRAAGIVGIRVNATGGSKDPQALKTALDRAGKQAAELGWHVQAYLPLKTIATLADTIEASPAAFVLDHFAGADGTGIGQTGLDRVLGLVRDGKAYVKLSAMYHESMPPEYRGMGELAAAFLGANSKRILWATDWPHTDSRKVPGRKKDDISPFYPVENSNLIEKLYAWVPDAATRKTILVDNPAQLFKFT